MGFIETILTGVVVFPFLAAVFTFPYAMHQYHRYGAVSKTRTLVIYSFVLYLLIAYFLVILPLPDPASTAGDSWRAHLNLVPFRQIWLYWHNRPLGMGAFFSYLKSFAFWQLMFNVLLTVPFGMYVRYYFKQSFGRTMLWSFLLSLFFELTQLSALYGIYPCPYRLADVEDLICNTLGGVFGYLIARAFMAFLPDRDAIDLRTMANAQRVTGRRRFWAAFFDYLLANIIFLFFDSALLIVATDEHWEVFVSEVLGSWSFFFVFSLVQVLATKGVTLGHAICRTTLVSADGRVATRGQLVKRYLYLWLFVELPMIVVELLTMPGSVLNPAADDLVASGLVILSRAYVVAYLLVVLLKRGTVSMPHDKLSGTMYVATQLPKRDAKRGR